MSLDTLYADGIEQGLQRWAAAPGPEPEASFSVTSFVGAGGKGLPSAALEVGGSLSDVLSAFGTAAAASDSRAGGMFSLPSAEEQKQQEDARQRMLRGDAFDTGPGNVMRRKAEEFAPDPITSHTADQVMHGLVRFGGKAVGAVATMGPVAGPLALGVEEANTATQRLRMEGVDTGTATKVGAVQGGMAAASVVLPLGGKTIMQTLGLVAVGGPGSYVAQESLSRQILEEAGYNDQASLHNPFDPLGLAISTVIPSGFGAFHARGIVRRGKALEAGTLPLNQLRPEELRGLKYDDQRLDDYASVTAEKYGVPPALLLAIKNAGEKSGPTATSPKGARGVMQFMPGTAKEMGLADPTDPLASIDAGARYMRKLFDAYGSWDAAVAHYNGGGTQAAIVRGGGQPTYNETRGYLERVRKYVQEHTAQDAAAKPENVDAARVVVLNETVAKSLPDTPDAMAQVTRAADIVAERGGRAAEAELRPAGLEVFHGTKAADVEIDNLSRTLDLGPHFTTSRETAQIFADSEGTPGRVLEGVASFGRSLELPDLDGWFPTRVAAAVDEAAGVKAAEGQQSPFEARVWAQMERAKNEFLDAQGEAYQTIRNQFGGLSAEQQALKKAVLDAAMERSQQAGYDAVRSELRAQGYDSIKYVNRNEGAPVDTYIALDMARVQRKGAADQPPRASEADNTLPPADSVTLAGDALAKPGAELGAKTQIGAKNIPENIPDVSSSASRETSSPAASLDAQIAQKLATEQPDLQVILPGTDTPISVKEALARIAEEQKQDAQWGDLVKVATECALSAG